MNWEYEYWFAALFLLSYQKKHMLREIFGVAETIYYIEEKRLKQLTFLTDEEQFIICQARKEWDVSKKYEELIENNIKIIPFFHSDYPEKLKEIPSPPYALYVKGKLPQEKKLSAAIVGARRCTPYGERMALEFGEALSRAGVQVVSGMARGVDGAGQRGALNAGGTTYGVLGCGVDICYPKEHRGLYMDIQKSGGIISEYPPGINPLPANFPARNRIISGLSDVVLVMEAKKRSGSLITADLALEQGKDVYALPGTVTSQLSQGCNDLIKQGADILISPEELLKDMGILFDKMDKNSDKNEKMLETIENIVYSCLDLCPKNISQIIDDTKRDSEEVLEILTGLQLKGYIKEISRHFYVKT